MFEVLQNWVTSKNWNNAQVTGYRDSGCEF